MPTIRVAHSPDSDDAFMFWALATDKIDTGDRRYVHELADIETLNRRALKGELEVTAVSIHAYGHLTQIYALLPHGASVGDRYGPRLVARTPGPPSRADVRHELVGKRVAIPGTLTTAFLALRLFQPDFEPVTVPFDEIEDAVTDGDVDAGLLIHEGQLTFAGRGLHLWLDLGEWWFGDTDGLPLPLGGNVVRRDLGEDLIKLLSRDLRTSIVYGLEHRDEALEYALRFARGLDRSDADAFVGMYVNDYTVDYGERGRRAVRLLLDRAADAGILPERATVTFVDDGLTG
jgi:1,4-dihydroxy-6-naphthoate synthase